MAIKARLFVLLPALLALGGCSSFQPGLGFSDVEKTVGERTGQQVYWNQGSEADREAELKVKALLAEKLTADTAIQIALLNNPRLQASYEGLGIAQADMVEAGLLRNPFLGINGRFGGEHAAFDFSIAQAFLDILYLPLRQRIGAANFDAQKAAVADAVLELAGEARSAFYDYQATEQRREMRLTVIAATDASYDLAKRLREAGNINELELANERALYEQSKLDLTTAELAAAQKRERLNALMGLWGKTAGAWRAAERMASLPKEELDVARLESRAVEHSFDLARRRRELEAVSERYGVAVPFAIFSDAELGATTERESEGPWTSGPSLSIPLPLFDQGQAARGRAGAELRRAEQEYRAAAIELRAAVRAALSRLITARDRVEYQSKIILPLRHRIVAETQSLFNGMLVGGFQLLQAKRDEIEAGTEYIGELHDYWQARGDLQQILSGGRRGLDGSAVSDPWRQTEQSAQEGTKQ